MVNNQLLIENYILYYKIKNKKKELFLDILNITYFINIL